MLPLVKHDKKLHQLTNQKRGIPKDTQADLFQSPSKAKYIKPSQSVAALKRKGHALTGSAQKKARRLYCKLHKEMYTQHLKTGEDRAWSGVQSTIELYRKADQCFVMGITMEEWPEHAVYLLEGGTDPLSGAIESYIAIPESNRFAAVISTENLLLNHYRQMCGGTGAFLQIDTSYRVSIEGWGLMPVKTVSPTQQGHTVAYAFVSKEDSDAHRFVLDAIKTAVVDVVTKRVRAGHKYV